MIFYFFFLILSFLPLIEGELLGIGRFLLLSSCLPLAIYLFRRNVKVGSLPRQTRLLYMFFVIFLFFALLSTIFSPVFSRSFNTLILYFVYLIYFLTARILAKEKKTLFRDLLIVTVIFPSLVLCLLSFYLVFNQEPPPFSSMNLIFANFGHNHLVDYLIFAFPLSLFLLFKEKDIWKKILFLLLNLIFLAGFILSFSRGGILMAILIIFLLQIFTRRKKPAGTRHAAIVQLPTIFMLLLLGFILLFSISGYYYLGEETIKNLNNLLLKKAFRQLHLSSRIEYWRQAVLAFKDKPLLGWGLDNFRYLSKKYQKAPSAWSWYTHNHFVQMFVETGIFGGLSFLFLIFFLLKKIQPFINKRLNLNDLKCFLTIGLFISVIHSLLDYDWQFPPVFLIFWVIAGYLTKCKMQSAKCKVAVQSSKLNNLRKTFLLLLGIMLFVIAVLEFTGNLFLFLGVENEEKINHQKAENYYQQSLAVWPFKLENWQVVIHYYQGKNQKEKALNLLNELIVFEPINDKNFRLLGNVYYENKEFDKAIEYYKKTINLNPMQENIYFKLIDIWQKKQKKDPQELFQILTQLEKIKGKKCLLKCLGFDNEEKILNLLLQLIESNDFTQLNKNQQAKVYYWLTILTISEQNWNKNIDWLQKTVELDNQKEYQLLLADILLINKIKASFLERDYQQAESLANQIISREKGHAFHQKDYLEEAYSFLGEIYFIREDLDKAFTFFEKANKICHWCNTPYLGLAKVYEKTNNLQKARDILQECIDIKQNSESCQKFYNNYVDKK